MMSGLFVAVFCTLVVASVANPMDFDGLTGRIINGQSAFPNQFPFHVTVVGHQFNNLETLCGGALVSPSHVLTAAHCVSGFNYEYFRVGFGSNNRSRPIISMEIDPNFYNTRIIHPQYNPNTFINDLALLRLPVNITGNHAFVAPIRLPANNQANNMFLNNIVHITGFGRPDNMGLPTNDLRFARGRVISQNECANFYGSAVANANTLCTLGADFNAQGPCANDNGGPLVLQENTGNTLIGINSFISTSGCTAGHPAGFARLGPHIQWIAANSGAPTRNN